MNARLQIALVLAAISALGAVIVVASTEDDEGAAAPVAAFEGASLPLNYPAPRFARADQDGEPLRMQELQGSPVIVTFLYTNCENTCPLQAQIVKGALNDLGEDVPALAVAVDPARDTPESARRFLAKQRMTGRMDFVLGTRKELQAIWTGYAIRPQSVTEEHTGRFVLVDKRGLPAGRLPARPGDARTPGARRPYPTCRVGFTWMMFSTKAEYGVRVMAHLARSDGAQPISLSAIAEAEGLPLAYLEHLVARLRRAELVDSRRGAHGGYTLARPAG